jgi:quercetin dioxygenase-like cupin family protein
MSPSPYVVRQDAVTPYSPLNHEATLNRRLVGRDNVGARQLEVVLGVVARGGGALKHSHPGIEQACYVLEGRARVEVGDDYVDEVGPGDTVFFPAGAPHVFTTISEAPVKVLVIYAPPYAETGAVRHATPHPAPARTSARGSNVTRRAR